MAESKKDKQEEVLSPKAYFAQVKGLKHKSTREDLEKYAAVQETLMKKATITGQKEQLSKLKFIFECLKREAILIDQGIDTFIYKEDILAYADKITDKSIRITELANYPREIPDEVVEEIGKLRKLNVFDEFFVVYTDYTEVDPQLKAKIEAERDPILFGTFLDKSAPITMLHSRFYYIADWVDEYCDLTLSKMIETMAKDGKNIEYKLSIPVTTEELSAAVNSLKATKKDPKNLQQDAQYVIIPGKKKASIFSRLNIFKRKKKD